MPSLILVSGPPRAGKSTLAGRLAGELGWPLLSKDVFKEAIADGWGVATLEESRRAGAAAVRVLYATGSELLGRGVSVVMESAFRRGLAEVDLAPLLAVSKARVLDCRAEREVCLSRYRARAVDGGRHPCHFDRERAGSLDWAAWEPLDLDVPVLTVDTADGYDPGWESVLSFTTDGVVPWEA